MKFTAVWDETKFEGRPPHGGRGLKLRDSSARWHRLRRPPHGGRGLKFSLHAVNTCNVLVAPRTGGVD